MAKAMKAKSTAPTAQAKRTTVESAEKKKKKRAEEGTRRSTSAGEGRRSKSTNEENGDDMSLRDMYYGSELFQVIAIKFPRADSIHILP